MGVTVLGKFCTEFQHTVGEYLVRHRSILDALTKFQESCARVNRAVAKAATTCGCIEIDVSKQKLPESLLIEDFKQMSSTHIDGELCDHCKDVVETELGNNLFYLAAICQLLGFELNDIVTKERERVSALGFFKMG